jgi:hypothetical protein
LAYACTYFWRYPIFMMPDEILLVSVVTIAGKTLDVHALLGMAFIAGFGSAKLPAMTYVSSQHFFHHRFKALCTIMVVSMLIECCGVLAFAHASPGTMVFCVYLSSFCSSFLCAEIEVPVVSRRGVTDGGAHFSHRYGAIITYLEGRQATEVMLAVGTAGYVCAGTFSRGLGSLVLDMGCPPTVMPLAIGCVGAVCIAARRGWLTGGGRSFRAGSSSARSPWRCSRSATCSRRRAQPTSPRAPRERP